MKLTKKPTNEEEWEALAKSAWKRVISLKTNKVFYDISDVDTYGITFNKSTEIQLVAEYNLLRMIQWVHGYHYDRPTILVMPRDRVVYKQ